MSRDLIVLVLVLNPHKIAESMINASMTGLWQKAYICLDATNQFAQTGFQASRERDGSWLREALDVKDSHCVE